MFADVYVLSINYRCWNFSTCHFFLSFPIEYFYFMTNSSYSSKSSSNPDSLEPSATLAICLCHIQYKIILLTFSKTHHNARLSAYCCLMLQLCFFIWSMVVCKSGSVGSLKARTSMVQSPHPLSLHLLFCLYVMYRHVKWCTWPWMYSILKLCTIESCVTSN